MPFAAVGGALAAGVAGAVVSSALAPSPSSGSSATGQAASAADPFASQRGQYQTMLQNLVTNPSSVTQTPGYQFGMDQGTAAVNSGEASAGYLNSGNRGVALEQFGQNYATGEYQQQFSNLAALSGANTGQPGEAGQILANQATQQSQQAGALGNSIGNAVSSGVTKYIQSPSSSASSGSFGYSDGASAYGGGTALGDDGGDYGGSLGGFLS